MKFIFATSDNENQQKGNGCQSITFCLWHCIIGICLFFLTSCITEDLVFTLEGSDIGKNIVAHRGNWKQHQLPQNSIASLKEALRLDIYGVEFDVRQTNDNQLVISHDALYQGLAIANNSYSDLKEFKLKNGEDIPTLDDFLTVLKNTQTKVKFVIELKECNVHLVLSLIDSYGLLERVEFVTFNKSYCDALVELGYGDKVSYTISAESSAMSPAEIKESGYGGVCYEYRLLGNHMEWIKDASELDVRINVWTIDDLFLIKRYADMGLIVTTNVAWRCVRL